MSTTTLSQRLRDLRHGIFPDIETVNAVLDDCIAQAEAQEGQAGELSDTEGHLPKGVTPYDDIAHYIAQGVDHLTPCKEDEDGDMAEDPAYQERVDDLVAILPYAFEYARKSGYLKPSQAIGEQTPVALDDRTFIALFAKVKCEFCEEGKDEGRTCATCHGLGMRDPDLYELRSRMRNLYRSPISPEARDRAIEALERIRELSGQAMLDDAKGGFGTPFVEIRTKAGKALSALRGS